MKEGAGNNKFSELRRRAQAFISAVPEKSDILKEDVQKLVHELDTYQIELELQNEDLRNTQQELEKSRYRYADLYDYAPVGYLTLSDKGMILEANLTAGGMLGTARGQLINQPFSNFIFQEDQDIFYLHRKKLLETHQKQTYDLRLKQNGGPIFYALVETVLHPEGDPLGHIRVMVSDISLRKEEELAKLQRLKDRYRAIVMDQKDLICRWDSQGRLTFVNDAYCRCFGVQHQNILGTNYRPNIHQDDVGLARDHFKTLTPHKPDKTIEYRVILQDGKIHWHQWSGRALYDQKGNVVEYQAVGRDITRQKEAEEKLQQEANLRQLFLDALPCIALLINYDTRVIIASNKAAAAVGAVPGARCHSTLMQKVSPCSWCLASKRLSENESKNTQFWMNDICWDAYWSAVDQDTYLHYLFDITEKQKIKEALKQAHDELERRVLERTLELQKTHAQLLHTEKLAAVGSLSASIAHEFNNPLQSVMTIIKGIEQYVPLEEKEQELVGLALQECYRMKNLIADLKDFFIPSSGELLPVDLHGIIDSLLIMSKRECLNRKIRIEKIYGSNIPTIQAVADQLKQVLLNIFNNAVDACNGGGLITITTEVNREHIVVHIEDNGTGITPADLGHIFEPFFTTKPGTKGTGLGLSVSYGIIKKHGGRIDVHSEPGKGSKFSVILPIEMVANEQ